MTREEHIGVLNNTIKMYEDNIASTDNEESRKLYEEQIEDVKNEIDFINTLEEDEYNLYVVYPKLFGNHINVKTITKQKLHDDVELLKRRKREIDEIIADGGVRVCVGGKKVRDLEDSTHNGVIPTEDLGEEYGDEKSENTDKQMRNTFIASRDVAKKILEQRDGVKSCDSEEFLKIKILREMGYTNSMDYNKVIEDEKLRKEYERRYQEYKEKELGIKEMRNILLENKFEQRKALKCVNSDISEVYSINEPFRSYEFIVKLPEKYNTKENEITYISIDRKKKRILVYIRESVGKMQIKNFLDDMNKKFFERIFTRSKDKITVFHLNTELETEYLNEFNNVKVTELFEEPLEYTSDKNALHKFSVEFEYGSEIIKRFDEELVKEYGKSAYQKQVSEKADSKEEDNQA
jgi:hypothetical protein